MNKAIQSIRYDKIFGIDIETVRQEKDFNEESPMFDLWAWKKRNKEDNTLLPPEEVVKTYYNEAPLFPEYGKIVCISIGYISDEVVYTKSFTGDEKKILKEFLSVIKGSGRKLLMHNKGFDMVYIQKRFFINFPGEVFPDFYNTVNIKPWESDNCIIDTMDLWKNIGWQNTSLAELAHCFGIPSPKDDINGSEVSRVYWEDKDIKRIAEYCEKDVVTVMNILRVWKGDTIIKQVSRTESKDVEIQNVPVLERIYDSSSITLDDVVEIKELVKSKGVSEEDKKILKDIIFSLSLETEMFKYETKEEVEEKLKIVDLLIKEL